MATSSNNISLGSNNTQQRPVSKTSEICRFFLHGSCKFGNSCAYSHDANIKREQIMCKYFLLGSCAFGDKCFFLHSQPTSNNTTTSPSVSSSGDNSDVVSTSPNKFSEVSQRNSSDLNGSKLVTRILNKPRLLTSMSANSTKTTADEILKYSKLSAEAAEFSYNNHSENAPTYSSYYEALTGKKLPDILSNNEIDQLDLNMFDENYVEYLKRRNDVAESGANSNSNICPYFEKNLECPFELNCEYIHGEICDICNMACLHPFDEAQRDAHKKECMKLIEKDMEEAFAVQRSSEKLCGICMEVVWEKEKASDKRFGILENCNHIFCLPCIRKWRASKGGALGLENKVVKACPECRVKSDFVTPSRFWFEDEQNKKKIIEEYKLTLKKTSCKYFKQDGRCPFGSKCFYMHQNKDGTLAELPEPTKRRRFNNNGDLETYSNMIHIDFDFSDEEDDEFDLLEFFRQNLLWENESDSEFSDFFELSDEYLI